jgi:hypothetical protein
MGTPIPAAIAKTVIGGSSAAGAVTLINGMINNASNRTATNNNYTTNNLTQFPADFTRHWWPDILHFISILQIQSTFDLGSTNSNAIRCYCPSATCGYARSISRFIL